MKATRHRAGLRSLDTILCVITLLALVGSQLSAASSSPGAKDLSKVGSNVPTKSLLESIDAFGYDGGVLIQWHTGFEIDNLGFRLYRDDGGERALITPQLLAGSALVTGQGTPLTAGKSYAWWDSRSAECGSRIADCQSGLYWLEEIDLAGQSLWHGVTAKHIGGPAPAQVNAAPLGGLGKVDAPSRPVESRARPLKIAAGKTPLVFGLASQQAVKIFINREGWYRITQAELLKAGLNPNTDPRKLQLYVDNQPLPILVTGEGDGHLDATDAVEFYGVGLDSTYTDTRVYWLAAGALPGSRITSVANSAPPVAGGSFPFAVERKDRTIYFSGLLNGETENFFGAVIASQPVNQALSVPHLDSGSSGATLEVALQGVTLVAHQIDVSLNGSLLGNCSFYGRSTGLVSLGVPPGLLVEGANQVTLAVAGSGDVNLVDYLRLTYNHTYAADNDQLKLAAAGGQQLTIAGFGNSAIRVFDITNPAAVQEVAGQVQQQGASYAVSFFAAGVGQRTLLALADNQASAAKQVSANLPSNWTKPGQGADFLIITPRDFFSSVQQLRVTRQTQGLSVAIVDIEDIYDEFSYGHKTPQAIYDFLSLARNGWKKRARYALIVGDASYDPKNYMGFGNFDFVPTKLIDTAFMEAASDDWFADFDGDGVPELAMGRLPVRNGPETEMMIAKILGYESASLPDEMLLVADSNDGYDFEGASAELHPLVTADVRMIDIIRGQLGDDATTKAAILGAIARGQRLVNYTGHGNLNQWRGNIFTNADAVALNNAAHLPVFLLMTCLNGYLIDPVQDSMAEALMKNQGGGAAAVWASAGLTLPAGQWLMNQELYRRIFSTPFMRVGDAARAAKLATTDTDVRMTWMLFGDPTMRLK